MIILRILAAYLVIGTGIFIYDNIGRPDMKETIKDCGLIETLKISIIGIIALPIEIIK